MTKKYKVYWVRGAEDGLLSVIKYFHSDHPVVIKNNPHKIKNKVPNLNGLPQRGRIGPEIKWQGILHYRELIIVLWKIIYRIFDSNVYVLSVIDSRKNIENILRQRLMRKQ